MREVNAVRFKLNTTEELLPDFDPAFPCITTCYPLEKGGAPWHWHRAFELFYVESGSLLYETPGEHRVFPVGSGGLINSSCLHATQVLRGGTQLLHLFDPLFIAGAPGSRIEEKYVLPFTAGHTEILPLSPDDPCHAPLLRALRDSFSISPTHPGYELFLRSALSALWPGLLACAPVHVADGSRRPAASEPLKQMLIFIHRNYGSPISVSALARAACVSQRTCFSLFQSCLHTTPMEYLRNYRLHMARRMLAESQAPITQIAAACGFDGGSRFAQLFRAAFDLTPSEYRKHVQEKDG